MNRRTIGLAAGAALTLAGCETNGTNPFNGGTGNVTTETSFVTPASNGNISHSLGDTLSGRLIDNEGDGYSYVVGTKPSLDVVEGQAGVVVGSTLDALPAAGSAVMTGQYGVAAIYDIAPDVVPPQGQSVQQSGLITLTADFAGGTLTGASGDLTVAGSFADEHLGGTVSFSGLSGTLQGQIGATKAVGAFAGRDADTVFAGGFVVDQ